MVFFWSKFKAKKKPSQREGFKNKTVFKKQNLSGRGRENLNQITVSGLPP
jgi:hypothetical protein